MKNGTYRDVRDIIDSNCLEQADIDAAMMQIEYLEWLARQVNDAPSFEAWLQTCRSAYARRLRRRLAHGPVLLLSRRALARRQQGAA